MTRQVVEQRSEKKVNLSDGSRIKKDDRFTIRTIRNDAALASVVR